MNRVKDKGTGGLAMSLALSMLIVAAAAGPARGDDLEDRVRMLEQQLGQLKAELARRDQAPAEVAERLDEAEDRLDDVELKQGWDRLNFSGQLRVTADSIHGDLAERFDGLALQKGIVDTLFFYNGTGMFPTDLNDVNQFIAQNYGDYLFYQDGLTFDWLKQVVGSFPPAQQEALFGLLLPGTYTPETDYDNDIVYTTKLNLDMSARVMKNLSFTGRLGMYKVWGDSTGVQVFNGQPNSFTLDGTDVGVPSGDFLRVERAYFDWKNLGGSNWYLSAGRRPSTEGPPLHVKWNELRQGTPNGHVVNYQFDGITLGVNLDEHVAGSTFRFCYGVGFESGWAEADQLRAPADRLDDVHFGGINYDIYRDGKTFVQTTILGAWDVTDGFNGLVVLPADPLSGNAIKAPVVLRYSPAANLGDIYLGEVMVERLEDNGINWFLSAAFSHTDPDDVTTPFGGLMSDPFETPESQDGWSVYAGIRFPVGDKDMIGFEYNHGSKYWFNFTAAADDLLGSKLATRGNVYEAYWLHEWAEGFGRARAKLLLSLQYYDFDYSGSGWNVGAPKKLDDSVPPILGFPTYSDAWDLRLAFSVKF